MLSSLTAPDAMRRPAVAMLCCVMAGYVLAALGGVGLPTMLAFAALLVAAVWALASVRDPRAAWMVASVLALLVIALGSPTDEWDPRSIWLFHARRIFEEGSLYAMLDGYAPFSHNDYPALVPLLSASSAQLVGHWNELFPKAAGTLLLLPALLLIARSLRTWWVAGLFAVVMMQIGGRYLADGYMDALLAVYAVAALATAARCEERTQRIAWGEMLPFVLSTAVLSLIKNEGMVLAAVITAATAAAVLLRERRVPWMLLIAFGVAMLPLLAWKLAVAGAHLTNDLASSDMKGQLLARLPELSNSALILKKLFREWALVPLLVLAILWRRTCATPVVLAGAVAGLVYAGVLYAVYLGTPHGLEWHLATSVKRVVLPVYLLLVYALLVVVDRWRSSPEPVPVSQ